MIYLRNFQFANLENPNTHGMTCYNSIYPFGILEKHQIKCIDFEAVTIFYGGNGSGKTTALNIIAEKLKVQRDNLYNKSNFFDDYLYGCKYRADDIPRKSRIITSDDVFDFSMNLRYINEGLDRKREKLFDEFMDTKWGYKFSEHKIKSLEDYEELKCVIKTKKTSKSQYIRNNMHSNIKEHSNGESAFIYFTDKIEENALYLLDEPENSLSPEKQQELLKFIEESVRFFNCQFIIATHSPFILSLRDAKIYDFDENPCQIKPWTELKNVRDYYNFFKKHEKEFQKPFSAPIYGSKPDEHPELTTWRKLMTRDLYSDVGKEVFDRLKEIWDNEDFIVGTMLELNTEEKLQKMLDYLIETGTKDSDDVIPYTLKLSKQDK